MEVPEAVKFDNLPKTEFGSGDVTKRFVWVEYDNGVRVLMDADQAEREGISTEGKTVIKVNHSSDTSDRLIASDEVSIDGTYVNNQITDSNDEHPWGAGVWVPRPGSFEDNELPSGDTVPGTSVETINGTYIGNYITNPNAAYGAGVANSLMDNIDEISGTFVGNMTYSDNATGNSGGAAISNDYMVGKISGDFIGNTAIGYNTAVGGAIIDNGENTLYSGNFIGNSVITTNQGYNGAFWGAYPGSVGGAIILALNGDGADFNGVNFYNNQAIALAEYMPAYGGSIFAYANELNFNYATFDGNQAIANSGQALGGAMMLSTNNTRLNNVVFRNNMVRDDGTDGYASGGAIKGAYGYLGVTNSSFYDNTAIARGENGWADGGAITLDTGLLEIVADGGKSEFSGNKVIGIDENGNEVERNEAIYLGTGAILNLTAVNDGVIKIDDAINRYGDTTSNPTVQVLTQDQLDEMVVQLGATVTQDGNKYTLSAVADEFISYEMIRLENGDSVEYYITKIDRSMTGESHEFRGTESEMMFEMFNYANMMSNGSLTAEDSNIGNGFRPNCNEDRSYCKVQVCAGGENAGFSDGVGGCIAVTATKVEEGFYIFEQKESGTQTLGIPDMLLVNGDDSGRIELNEKITGFPMMLVNGGNVFFGEKSKVDYTIDAFGGSVNKAQIEDGGVLNVAKGAIANDTTVNSGGKLLAAAEAKVNGLLANGGALIDLDAGTVLTGDVKFDIDATLQGGFDYSTIFDEIVTETGSLTLEGGINTALNQNSLVNTAEDKNLVLSNGDFEVGTGAKEVAGWKELNVINDATVKLVADANSESYINFGTLNLLKDTTLNLSGNSPLLATVDGSVNNDGHLNFNHSTDSADDVTTIKGNYKAYKNAMMTIDVDPITNVADKLVVEGDVEGRTKVVINPLSNDLSTGKALFVEAMNDDTSTGAYFDVYRVVGDAHKWNTLYEDNKWYAATDNIIAASQSGYGTVKDEELVLGGNTDAGDTNITQPKPQVVSEAIAYMSLPRIGLEQTKDLMRVVSNKVAASKVKCGNCGMSDYEYDGQAVNGVWIDLGHKKSEIDAPVTVEAKINAVDLGFDIQKDLHNRLGIFASYRQGEYELSGDGEDYYAKEGADIDIDSWILGLYHRYDKGRLWTMSSIYGGLQKVDMHTDDGVSADTDGVQFGGSVEAGLVFEPQKRLTIEPSIRLGYNFIKYDDMSDAYGKTAKYDNIHNVEAEAGVKVEKTFFHDNRRVISKIYVKPSVIQNFGKGDVNITSLDTVEGLENETMLRGEIGGSFNFGNGWGGFGSIGYTYGSDYNATDFNLGLGYRW